MKTMSKFFGLVILAVSMFSFNASAAAEIGETHSDLGKYWLKEASHAIEVEGETLPTFVIHYDELSAPVYVAVKEDKKVKTFIVRSEGFEVAYQAKKGKFGITYMPKEFATLPSNEAKAKINRENFVKQRVISSNELSEQTQLGLIAAYLPQVME